MMVLYSYCYVIKFTTRINHVFVIICDEIIPISELPTHRVQNYLKINLDKTESQGQVPI
jgi:hypothetical protein